MAFSFSDITPLFEGITRTADAPLYLCLAAIAVGVCANPVLALLHIKRARGVSPAWWLLAPSALIILSAYGELASYQQMSAALTTAIPETQLKHTARGISHALQHQAIGGLGLALLGGLSALSLCIAHVLGASSPRVVDKKRGALAFGVGAVTLVATCLSLALRAYKPGAIIALSVAFIGLGTLALVPVYLIRSNKDDGKAEGAVTGGAVMVMLMTSLWGLAQSVRAMGRYQAFEASSNATPESRAEITTTAISLMNLDYTSLLTGLLVLTSLGGIALILPSLPRTLRDPRASRALLAAFAVALVALALSIALHMLALSHVTGLDPLLKHIALGQGT